MKKLFSLFIMIVAATAVFSQAPGIFNYQGVARNSVGNVLVNQTLVLRLTIHDGTGTGPVVYQESRNVTTNPFGLFNVQVGSPGASTVTGTITGVNWAVGLKYIQVEIDPGTGMLNIGTAQLASVPYSLYSALSGDLVLPFLKTQADPGTLFRINNSGTGVSGGIMGTTLSNAANAWGVHGRVDNTNAGGFSSGVLGTNLSTSGFGVGVTGSQNGSGWGVYGTTPSGIGVNGVSTSGFGVTGSSVSGTGGSFSSTSGLALNTAGNLRFTGIGEGAPVAPATFKLLAGDPAGNASWQHASSLGLVTGSGTLNFVPKWTPNGTTLGNSLIFDDGSNVGIATITPTNKLEVIQPGATSAILGSRTTATGTAAGVTGISASTDANAVGTHGIISSTTPGGFSAAVRGTNNGTGGLGIGVYGSQGGSGWGVYGTSPAGIGVHGNSANGFGVYGLSTNGIGVYGLSTTGESGHFDITNATNNSTVVRVTTNSIGGGMAVQLSNPSNGSRGIEVSHSGVGTGVLATSAGGTGVWGITSAISAAGVLGDNIFGEAVVGRNRGGNGVGAVVGRNDSTGYGVRGFNTKDGIGVLGQAGISGGTGLAGRFENVNASNTNNTVTVATNGIGSGINVQLTNASNGARGIDVLQTGVGPGVFATSSGGNAVWGITSSISAAGVIGDNLYGEAVVGRNRGGNGVGAVVGRNDSSGYGVRGFNTRDGIGVLGQAGISGGTGVGGRFENVNAANGNDALQAATNGTGWSGNFVNANNSSASRAVRMSTTAGQGGNALTVANGTVAFSYQHPYASNTVVDDATLVVTTAGNVTIPTGPPLVDGAHVWVVNNSGAAITITNTTAGALNVAPGRAQHLLFVSTVSGANWIPAQ